MVEGLHGNSIPGSILGSNSHSLIGVGFAMAVSCLRASTRGVFVTLDALTPRHAAEVARSGFLGPDDEGEGLAAWGETAEAILHPDILLGFSHDAFDEDPARVGYDLVFPFDNAPEDITLFFAWPSRDTGSIEVDLSAAEINEAISRSIRISHLKE